MDATTARNITISYTAYKKLKSSVLDSVEEAARKGEYNLTYPIAGANVRHIPELCEDMQSLGFEIDRSSSSITLIWLKKEDL